MEKYHTVNSRYGFDETLARLQTAIKGKGMKVFALIDHQAAAEEAGITMQPATVIVFGTPKAGTPLMQKDYRFALELPLKVLVTEHNGQVQTVYHDVRHVIDGSGIHFDDVAETLAKAPLLIGNATAG